MLRVFHVPSHLTYVRKLAGDRFTPAPPPFGVPLRVADLLALGSWNFFDVLHLHSVELVNLAELAMLAERLRCEGKGLVFTVHDLAPNIEADHDAFIEKVRFVTGAGPRLITLTRRAASDIARRFRCSVSVIPHGFAVPPAVATPASQVSDRLLVFGALRPKRDLLAVVGAWRLLPKDRPPLHILLRSVSSFDRQRYARDLAELDSAARSEPGLVIDMVDHVVSSEELVRRCRTATLVLPYHAITHSGQLELARDLGVPVVAPDVPTVRAQLDEADGAGHPCVWFPTKALNDQQEFSTHLEKAASALNSPTESGVDISRYRISEHQRIIRQHQSQYDLSLDRR